MVTVLDSPLKAIQVLVSHAQMTNFTTTAAHGPKWGNIRHTDCGQALCLYMKNNTFVKLCAQTLPGELVQSLLIDLIYFWVAMPFVNVFQCKCFIFISVGQYLKLKNTSVLLSTLYDGKLNINNHALLEQEFEMGSAALCLVWFCAIGRGTEEPF